MRLPTILIASVLVLAMAGESTATDPSTEGTGSPADYPLESAVAILESGRARAAIDLLHTHLRAHPEDRELAVRFSRQLGERGLHELRLELLSEVLRYDPLSHAAALEMGVLLKTYRRFGEAVPYFESIPDTASGHHAMAQLNLADCYRVLGRFDAARETYERLAQSRRYTDFATAGLCIVELSQGLLEDCRRRLEDLSHSERGRGIYAQVDLLLAYLSGQHESCPRLLEAIRSRREEGVFASAIPILIAVESGEPDAAANLLEARQLVTMDGEHTALRAIVAAAQGEHDDALELYREAIEHNAVFARPREAAAILMWRAPVMELAESLLVADSRPPPTTRSDDSRQTQGRGCCGVAVTAGGGLGWGFLSLTVLVALALRRRNRKRGPYPHRSA